MIADILQLVSFVASPILPTLFAFLLAFTLFVSVKDNWPKH